MLGSPRAIGGGPRFPIVTRWGPGATPTRPGFPRRLARLATQRGCATPDLLKTGDCRVWFRQLGGLLQRQMPPPARTILAVAGWMPATADESHSVSGWAPQTRQHKPHTTHHKPLSFSCKRQSAPSWGPHMEAFRTNKVSPKRCPCATPLLQGFRNPFLVFVCSRTKVSGRFLAENVKRFTK